MVAFGGGGEGGVRNWLLSNFKGKNNIENKKKQKYTDVKKPKRKFFVQKHMFS